MERKARQGFFLWNPEEELPWKWRDLWQELCLFIAAEDLAYINSVLVNEIKEIGKSYLHRGQNKVSPANLPLKKTKPKTQVVSRWKAQTASASRLHGEVAESVFCKEFNLSTKAADDSSTKPHPSPFAAICNLSGLYFECAKVNGLQDETWWKETWRQQKQDAKCLWSYSKEWKMFSHKHHPATLTYESPKCVTQQHLVQIK